MSFFEWRTPKSSYEIYYLDPKLTALCCKKLDFDTSMTKYRMNFYEYSGLIKDLHASGSPHLTYVRIIKGLHFLFTLALLAAIISFLAAHDNISLDFPSYFFEALAGYLFSFVLLFLIQKLQQRRAARKMKAYLDVTNPIAFHTKRLHWDIHDYGKYLILHLDYTPSGSASSTALPSPFQTSTIDMFFNKSSPPTNNLDYSLQSFRQSMTGAPKYAF